MPTVTNSAHAILMTVGGTAEPLIHSLLSAKPKFLAFVCSHETFPTASKVKEQVERELAPEEQPRCKIFIVDNPADLVECHGKVIEALSYLRQEFNLQKNQIKIDYTGGTKTMSAAAVLAAAPDGYEFIYISGSERTKGGVGIVVSGHEQIVHPLNPWIVLEESAVRRILTYTCSKQWAAALVETEELEKRSDESRKYLFKSLLKVLQGLREWDRFNHTQAQIFWKGVVQTDPGKPDLLQNSGTDDVDAKDSITLMKADTLSEFCKLASVAQQSLLVAFGKKCQSMIGRLDKLCHCAASIPDNSPDPMTMDMLSNADRTAAVGEYDYAVLLLYRAIELFVDRRLRLIYGIDNSNVEPASVPAILRDDLSKRRETEGQFWKLGLVDSTRLLSALGDNYVKALLDKLDQRSIDITARNLCWLIHGNQHATEKQFKAFRQSILGALSITDANIPKWPDLAP